MKTLTSNVKIWLLFLFFLLLPSVSCSSGFLVVLYGEEYNISLEVMIGYCPSVSGWEDKPWRWIFFGELWVQTIVSMKNLMVLSVDQTFNTAGRCKLPPWIWNTIDIFVGTFKLSEEPLTLVDNCKKLCKLWVVYAPPPRPPAIHEWSKEGTSV